MLSGQMCVLAIDGVSGCSGCVAEHMRVSFVHASHGNDVVLLGEDGLWTRLQWYLSKEVSRGPGGLAAGPCLWFTR